MMLFEKVSVRSYIITHHKILFEILGNVKSVEGGKQIYMFLQKFSVLG